MEENSIEEVREDRNKEIKSFLKEVEDEKKFLKDTDSNTETKIVHLKWIRWVAAVLILGIISWAAWSHFNLNSQELFTEYFSSYPNDFVRIERSSSDTNPLQSAFIAYQDKDYDSAIQQFDRLLNSSNSDNILFFKAVSLLSKGETEFAINIFRNLKEKEDWQYSEAVRWYLALGYLKLEQITIAKDLLEQIANSENGHFNQSSAKEILQKLNK